MRLRQIARKFNIPLAPSLSENENRDLVADSSFPVLPQVAEDVQNSEGRDPSMEKSSPTIHRNNGKMKKPEEMMLDDKEGQQVVAGGEEESFCLEVQEDGWQCGALLKPGQAICDQHFNQLQSNSMPKSARSQRSEKWKWEPGSSDAYLYYSDFGPSWSKRKRRSSCARFSIGASSSSVCDLETPGNMNINIDEEARAQMGNACGGNTDGMEEKKLNGRKRAAKKSKSKDH